MTECDCGDPDCMGDFCSVDSPTFDDPTTGTTRFDDHEPWFLSDENPNAPQWGDGE